jgi:hypothetical protein
LQILWVLHFIAATIEKQQGLGTIDNLMFTRTLFCTENSFTLFPEYENTVVTLRMTKAKIDFCKFFEFCIL